MYSIKSLRRRTRRVFLTVLGVALSIALTVTMLSIGEGLRTSTDDLVRSTGVDLFIVPKGSDYLFFNLEFTEGTELSQRISDDLGTKADTVFPRYTPNRQLYIRKASDEQDESSLGAQANGVVPGLLGDISGFSVEDGTYFEIKDDRFSQDPAFLSGVYDPAAFSNFTGEIVISKALAKEAGLGADDRVVLSASRSFQDNVTLTVTGIYVADFESS